MNMKQLGVGVAIGAVLAAGASRFHAAPGDTRLADAVMQSDRDAVRSLLQQKADVNAAQVDGMTALHWAARHNDIETVQTLVKAGANVNAKSLADRAAGRGGPGGGGAAGAAAGGGRGGAPAAAAAKPAPGGPAPAAPAKPAAAAGAAPNDDSASARIAQTFRRGSQMPSANAVPNQTALHGAAEHGFDKYIEFLVAHGADLTAKDVNGRTPLDTARGAGGARGGADAYPKTVVLIEALMKEKGLPVPSVPGR